MLEHFSFPSASTASHHPSDLHLCRYGGTYRDRWEDDHHLPCPTDSLFTPPCSPHSKPSVSVLDLERELSMHSLNNNNNGSLPSPDEEDDERSYDADVMYENYAMHQMQDGSRRSSTSFVSSSAQQSQRRSSAFQLSQPLSPPTSSPSSTPSPPPSHPRNHAVNRPAPTLAYHAQTSATIRSQRQRAVRAQCSATHLREVSAMVARMVENGDQCRVCESRSTTPPSLPSNRYAEEQAEEDDTQEDGESEQDAMQVDGAEPLRSVEEHAVSVSEHEDEGFVEDGSSDGRNSPASLSLSLRFRRSSDWGRDFERDGRAPSCLVQRDARVRKRAGRRR